MDQEKWEAFKKVINEDLSLSSYYYPDNDSMAAGYRVALEWVIEVIQKVDEGEL